uniref:3-deoxy-manno-octulosonate cytidylyltransferase n=1 Tax=Glossina austeni TaxID=7395 RepID=A0A1A9UK83_GLOAU
MNFIVIIPARLLSTRFPNKPLSSIGGKPMIIRTIESAERSAAKRIIIATDNQKIANIVKKHGKEVYITNKEHNSGTERLFEIVEKLEFENDQIIVNLQVDEPFIPGSKKLKILYKLYKRSLTLADLPDLYLK